MKFMRVTKSAQSDGIRYYSIVFLDVIGFSFMAGLISGVHITLGLIIYKLEFNIGVSQWNMKVEKKNENAR